MILDAPDSYAAHFDLAPAEAAALAGMAADLASLTLGFVQKREKGLRRIFAGTLSLLGDEATPLVEDYSDAYAAVDSPMGETLRFADFLVEEARALADSLPYGSIVVDVARYERLRIRSFMTEGPLWPRPEETPLDPRQVDRSRRLWLHRSAAVEAFGWDVRTVRSPQILPRLRPDPANLLCFQRGEEAQGTVLRIDDECARAVELIALRPGEVSAAEIGEVIGSDRSPEVLLGKLIGQGAIRGAES
jgi:hypothetical protein